MAFFAGGALESATVWVIVCNEAEEADASDASDASDPADAADASASLRAFLATGLLSEFAFAEAFGILDTKLGSDEHMCALLLI